MEAFLWRILSAFLVGLVIGVFNRNLYMVRILTLVCVGAALVTYTSVEFFQTLALPWYSDPGRLSAQIVSALGFIGTGFIWISDNKEVRGISHAAVIWLTAIVGMLIGAGLSYPTVAALFFILVLYWLMTSVLPHWTDRES